MSRQSGMAIGVAIALAGLGVAYHEMSANARESHALRSELDALERAIRAHDAAIWRRVEAEHDGGAVPDEDRHRQLLADFDRLGHLERFAMEPLKVDISGDTALVGYRVEGRSVRRGDPPAPTGGEFEFKKGADGAWRVTSHRLFER